MRDRLIELLLNVDYALDTDGRGARDSAEFIADYLLANGVIVPPCKLGDTVWYISTENPHVAFQKELKPRKDPIPVKGILITEDGIYVSTDGIEGVKDRCDKVGEDYAYLSEEDAWAEIKQKRNPRESSFVKARPSYQERSNLSSEKCFF